MPDDAEVAYTAFAEHQHWQSFQGAALPAWAQVPQDIKDAWRVAIGAVRRGQPPQPGD